MTSLSRFTFCSLKRTRVGHSWFGLNLKKIFLVKNHFTLLLINTKHPAIKKINSRLFVSQSSFYVHLFIEMTTKKLMIMNKKCNLNYYWYLSCRRVKLSVTQKRICVLVQTHLTHFLFVILTDRRSRKRRQRSRRCCSIAWRLSFRLCPKEVWIISDGQLLEGAEWRGGVALGQQTTDVTLKEKVEQIFC